MRPTSEEWWCLSPAVRHCEPNTNITVIGMCIYIYVCVYMMYTLLKTQHMTAKSLGLKHSSNHLMLFPPGRAAPLRVDADSLRGVKVRKRQPGRGVWLQRGWAGGGEGQLALLLSTTSMSATVKVSTDCWQKGQSIRRTSASRLSDHGTGGLMGQGGQGIAREKGRK